MAKEASTPAKFSITRKIMEFLKLGDSGKLDSFFSRVEKALVGQIKAINKNIDTKEFVAEQKLDSLKDKLEDAQAELEDAYLGVTPEDVTTNGDQIKYMEKYLENIHIKRNAIKEIEEEIASVKENLESEITAMKEDIAQREEDIKAISGK